ncbi:MAG: segregation/condensation protein A [Eggerthellaceae bacterium]|nr:segregation/condensation protein A [Eggerthellaceae bacterium]
MVYKVSIESFEGPFDLLLYLVSKQRVDIGTISITQIIDQYLAEISSMKNLDLDVASDFLLVAATLLKIKAESLLPNDSYELDEDVAALAPSEARDILVERLLTYKQFKNAAANLEFRYKDEANRFARLIGPGVEFANVMPDYLERVKLTDLSELAASAIARREAFLLESEHIAAKPIPVESFVKSIHGRIRDEKRIKFNDLVHDDTPVPVKVVYFLAVLELYKRGMVTMKQRKQYGDIDIRYVEGSGEYVAPKESEYDGVIMSD